MRLACHQSPVGFDRSEIGMRTFIREGVLVLALGALTLSACQDTPSDSDSDGSSMMDDGSTVGGGSTLDGGSTPDGGSGALRIWRCRPSQHPLVRSGCPLREL
jgi:hypothetical protein